MTLMHTYDNEIMKSTARESFQLEMGSYIWREVQIDSKWYLY